MDRRQLLTGAGALLTAGALGCRPARPQAPPASRIVVVGAGLSGLAIAHELVKRGRDVLVLEATAVPGGRIRTIRSFRDGLYVEAGAKHVLGDPDLIALMEDVGVDGFDGKREKLARVVFRGDERRVYAPGEPAPDRQVLSPEETALGEEGRDRRFLGLVDRLDLRAMQWSGELAAIDRLSAADWLRGMGASPGYIASQDFPLGDGLASMSALAFVRELAAIRAERRGRGAVRHRGHGGGRIVGGSDSLPRAIARGLGERVVYGAAVQRIEHRPDGATLVVRDRARAAPDRCRPRRADDAVPGAPPDRGRAGVVAGEGARDRRARHDVGDAGLARGRSPVLGRSRRGGPGRDRRRSPRPAGRDRSPPRHRRPARPLPERRDRARLGPLDREATLRRGADEVERLQPGLREHLVGGERIVWDREPFIGGAYAFFAPGQLTEHAAAAAAPEGMIHFAGDGTSYRPGFMHGAVASARRVVAELVPAPGL